MAVSIPTKCLRNPTSGSALISDYTFRFPTRLINRFIIYYAHKVSFLERLLSFRFSFFRNELPSARTYTSMIPASLQDVELQACASLHNFGWWEGVAGSIMGL